MLKQRDIAIALLFFEDDKIDQFFFCCPLGFIVTEIFHKNLPGICMKQNPSRQITSQVFSDDWDFFRFQKSFHELNVPLWNTIEILAYVQDMPAAENLRLETGSIGADFHQFGDEQFHGINPVSCAGRVFRICALWQHEMIHPANTCFLVIQASGYARSENGIQNKWLAAGTQPADINAYA